MTTSYEKYEGHVANIRKDIKTLQTQRIDMETDWKGFKYYKEQEFRKVENRYLKLMHDFREVDRRSKEFIALIDRKNKQLELRVDT